jgi:hypothetical protein
MTHLRLLDFTLLCLECLIVAVLFAIGLLIVLA